MQAYLDAIRSRVCSVCIDGIFDEKKRFVRCGLPIYRTCPVELYVPELIEVVKSVDSPNMEDYAIRLREKVCAICEQDEHGICDLRLQADCALDRYFLLVAEAVESVEKKQKS